MASDHSSARDFAALSAELTRGLNEQITVREVTRRAVQSIPGCSDASITIRRRRQRLETLAPTSELAAACDDAQYALGEGPCVESVFSDSVHLSNDLTTDTRWPQWGPNVTQLGVRSVLSVRLASDDEVIGALNMYSLEVDAFDSEQLELAQIFTQHASNALASARLVEGLHQAVDSRHLIGVAQGVLMHTYGISMDAAFELLRRYSNHLNIPLREVAGRVVEEGKLPPSDH